MSKEQQFFETLTDEQKKEYLQMSSEKRKKYMSEAYMSGQDRAMEKRNEKISQLEGRIATKSWQ